MKQLDREEAPRRLLITICVIMATVLQTLDSTIANVALPYMQGSLAASQEEISWVLTSYIVAAAIMTAPVGYLSGRFGRTRVFVVSIVGFTIGSVLCGVSQSLAQIVVFRVLQGMFGAALVPLSLSTLLDIWPLEKRGFAMALFTIGALVGPIVGPTLGGWLTENYNWRWVFFINVPFGALATLGLITFLKETSFNKAVRLDWTGFAALSIGVGALQTLLDRGETQDWFSSPEIQIEAILCGLGFYIFLTHSLLTPKPFLSPRLFKDLNFLAAILIMFVLGLILFATMALMAPYLQLMMNYPVSTAGLLMAPRGAGAMLCALLSGRILGRIGARKLVFAGFLACIYSLYTMTHWTPDISDWTIIQAGFVQGIGLSLISVPLSTVGFSTLPEELRAEGAGIFNLTRNLGSSIGISVTAALLETNTQVNHAILSSSVTPFDRALQSGRPLAFWNPGSTHGAAALDAMITQQSSVIAYIDDFKLMLIFAIATTPLVFLLHSGRPVVAPPRAVAE